MARLIALLPALTLAVLAHAQNADRAIRKGNAAFLDGNLQGAISDYAKAGKDERGMFNLGNAWYKEDSARLAGQSYENAVALSKDPLAQARAYHNLGNSWMKQGKFQEAINAYKEALKRTPADGDTRYNLAYAQKMLARQQQQDKNKDNGGDQKDQQDKQQQDKQQGDQGKQKQDQQQKEQQQQQQQRIDPQDAKRMLDAAQQQEQDVQDKVRQALQPKPATPPDKDW